MAKEDDKVLILIKELLLFKPAIVYFQISTTGISFFRDSLFVLIMKFCMQ